MSVVRKQFTRPSAVARIDVRPDVTWAVLAVGSEGWFLWSTHTTETAAHKSATAGRLKSGNRVIVKLEDVS